MTQKSVYFVDVGLFFHLVFPIWYKGIFHLLALVHGNIPRLSPELVVVIILWRLDLARLSPEVQNLLYHSVKTTFDQVFAQPDVVIILWRRYFVFLPKVLNILYVLKMEKKDNDINCTDKKLLLCTGYLLYQRLFTERTSDLINIKHHQHRLGLECSVKELTEFV